MAIAAYATEYDISQLTCEQLDLAGKIVIVLKPIDEITPSISTNHSSISIVIPFIRVLRKLLERSNDDDGVRIMKKKDARVSQ